MFRPEVEATIKVALATALAMAYLVTFSWGYEGHRQARHWREVACEVRLGELERALARLDDGARPCETLDRAGIRLARAGREGSR